MNSRKFKYVIAPEGCDEGIIPGKKYKITGYSPTGNFIIYDEKNRERICREQYCAHLNFKDWIIPPTKKYTLTINGTETFESDSFDDIINKVDTYNAKDINVIIES